MRSSLRGWEGLGLPSGLPNYKDGLRDQQALKLKGSSPSPPRANCSPEDAKGPAGELEHLRETLLVS